MRRELKSAATAAIRCCEVDCDHLQNDIVEVSKFCSEVRLRLCQVTASNRFDQQEGLMQQKAQKRS